MSDANREIPQIRKPKAKYDNNKYVKKSRAKKKAALKEMMKEREILQQLKNIDQILDIEKKKLRKLRDQEVKCRDGCIDLSGFQNPDEIVDKLKGIGPDTASVGDHVKGDSSSFSDV